jgi:hypothetical protein
VLGVTKPVLAGYQTMKSADPDDIRFSNPRAYDGVTKLIEHPNNRYNYLETWKGETLITHALGLVEVETPKKITKIKSFLVKFVFFYSCLDILMCFKSLSVQLKIIKQLVKHRTLKVDPNQKPPYLKTGVYVDVDGVTHELYLDVKDQSGKGVGGLDKQISALGIKLLAKLYMNEWKEDMDIPYNSLYPSCAIGSVVMVDGKYPSCPLDKDTYKAQKYNGRRVNHEKGEILHQWFKAYTIGDVRPNFLLDFLSHEKMTKASKQLGLDYSVPSFNTAASATSRIVVQMIAKKIEDGNQIFFDDNGLTEKGRNILGQILSPQSGFALNEYGGNIKTMLTTDGGYCKNMTPRRVRFKIGSLVLDIDLKGCYMEGMACQDYPVGRPIVKAFKYKEVRPLLGEFLAKHRSEFVPKNWMLRFSTKILSEETKGKLTLYKRYKLGFEQDLFPSKHFDSRISGDFIDDTDDDGQYFVDEYTAEDSDKADFQLTSREITYTILTHDLLQVLEEYAKPSELKEIMENCVVEAYWYYPKSQLVDSYQTFFDRFKPETDVNYKHNHTWCIIPMRDIAQPFIDLRGNEKIAGKVAKSLSRGKSVSESDAQIFLQFHGKDIEYWSKLSVQELKGIATDHDAGQYTFKITGLTIYGTAGSFHYQTPRPETRKNKDGWTEHYNPKHGHFLVANHITARARVAVWCLSKVLNTSVVITDGGMLEINSTRFWEWVSKTGHHLGLHELSRMTNHELTAQQLHKNRLNIQTIPLGGWGKWRVNSIEGNDNETLVLVNEYTPIAPIVVQNESLSQLDDIAYQQTADIFSKLDIFKESLVRFASKDLYGGAAVHSQSNYILSPITFEGKQYGSELVKMRGQKVNSKSYKTPHGRSYMDINDVHPCVRFMRQLLNDPTNVEPLREFYTDYLLSVNQFNQTDKIFNDYIERGFLPGSAMSKRSFIRGVSLSTFRWQTRHQYESWKVRDEKMKDKLGYGLEGFFLSPDGTNYNYEIAIKCIQDCIDDGLFWINPKRTGYEHGQIHPQHYEWAVMFPSQEGAFIPSKELEVPKDKE